MKIVFATDSEHKLEEIKDILGKDFETASLTEIGCHEDIPKTGVTLEENACQKLSYIVEHYGQNCFADDTGLEVKAFGSKPGAHSACYARGADHDSEANMRKLSANLERKTGRKTYLRTIISLIIDDVEHQFEGKVEDRIAIENHGAEGFGYDPIFISEGCDKSFAELGEEIKNQTSHRAGAAEKSTEYLGELKG